MDHISLVTHPDFPVIEGWLRPQIYGRDTSSDGRARRRVELRKDAPAQVVKTALGIVVNCPNCGDEMSPFRRRLRSDRGPDPSIYFAAACPELPTRDAVDKWFALASNPHASEHELRSALLHAAGSFRTCCKGASARDAHEAVVEALEGTAPAPSSQETLFKS
ncbi:MAG: hypothetical protein GY772_17400 [bacterium]|nr:hypothetical protein [bacterium]